MTENHNWFCSLIGWRQDETPCLWAYGVHLAGSEAKVSTLGSPAVLLYSLFILMKSNEENETLNRTFLEFCTDHLPCIVDHLLHDQHKRSTVSIPNTIISFCQDPWHYSKTFEKCINIVVSWLTESRYLTREGPLEKKIGFGLSGYGLHTLISVKKQACERMFQWLVFELRILFQDPSSDGMLLHYAGDNILLVS